MPATKDFRTYPFNADRLDAAGKNVGQRVYWKLYAIENLVRVMTHSVLTAQVGADWWNTAVDPGIREGAQRRRADYTKQSWHTTPGNHDIYYALLTDLSRIIAANSHLFKPLVHDVDGWIARIEQLRLPRNIVGHMNWPHKTDRQRIDVVHSDLQQLVQQLAASGTALSIP